MVKNFEVRKLTQYENVNERRARRLIKEFGSYDAVMAANYRDLLDVHYIGKKTARSIHRAGKRQRQQGSLL